MASKGDLYFGSSSNDSNDFIENRYFIRHNAYPINIAELIQRAKNHKVEGDYWSGTPPLINNLIALQPNMFILNNNGKESGYTYRINEDENTIVCTWEFCSEKKKIFDGTMDDFYEKMKSLENEKDLYLNLKDKIKYGSIDEIKTLLENNIIEDIQEEDYSSLIDIAIETKEIEKIQFLLASNIVFKNKNIMDNKELLNKFIDNREWDKIEYFLDNFKSPIQKDISTRFNIIDFDTFSDFVKEEKDEEDFKFNLIDSINKALNKMEEKSIDKDYRFNSSEQLEINTYYKQIKTDLHDIKEILECTQHEILTSDEETTIKEKYKQVDSAKKSLLLFVEKTGFYQDTVPTIRDDENIVAEEAASLNDDGSEIVEQSAGMKI